MIVLVPWIAIYGYALMFRGLAQLAGKSEGKPWGARYGGRPLGVIESLTPPKKVRRA